MPNLILPEDIASIEQLAKNGRTEHVVKRARLLLLLDGGKTAKEVGLMVNLSPGTVNKWRRAYQLRGMAIFPDAQPGTKPVANNQTPPATKKKKKPMSKNKKRAKRITKAVLAATAVAKAGKKKLGKIRKSKSYKNAIARLSKEREAALKLLKRVKKGKKTQGITKQLKRLQSRVAVLEKFQKKGKKK